MLESELFGHEKGAFTDAVRSRRGLLLEANGGTLVLDDVGSLSPNLQAKLLRALQERTIRPVGGSSSADLDVRVIALSTRELEPDVESGRFRADLYYRLNVIRLRIPPLRERGLDVIHLARAFVQADALREGRPVVDLTPAAAERLLSHHWPGNVRELRNCIDSAIAAARFMRLTPSDLPVPSRGAAPSEEEAASLPSLETVSREHVARIMAEVDGNVSRAAALLDVDRKTLSRRLRAQPAGSSDRTDDGSATGSQTEKAAPDSIGSTAARPPMSSTTRRRMASPSPARPGRVVKNGSKTRSR
jgi:DNA-binding NtrC family response regulator